MILGILIDLYMALCLFNIHILLTFGYSQYLFELYQFLHFTYYSNHTLCHIYSHVYHALNEYMYLQGCRQVRQFKCGYLYKMYCSQQI